VEDHHVHFVRTELRRAEEGTAPVVEIQGEVEIVAAEVVDIDSVLQEDFDSDAMVDAEMGGCSHDAVEKRHVGATEGKPREVDRVVMGEVKQRYVADLGGSSGQVHVIAKVRPLGSFAVV
jgi:hypothetical protein